MMTQTNSTNNHSGATMKPTSTPSTNQHAALTAPIANGVNTILDQLIVGQDPSMEDEAYFIHHAEDCSPCFDSIGETADIY